jgi:hypothetical protein
MGIPPSEVRTPRASARQGGAMYIGIGTLLLIIILLIILL